MDVVVVVVGLGVVVVVVVLRVVVVDGVVVVVVCSVVVTVVVGSVLLGEGVVFRRFVRQHRPLRGQNASLSTSSHKNEKNVATHVPWQRK